MVQLVVPIRLKCLLEHPGMMLKTSPPKGEATWDSVHTELVSRCKLYGIYLTVEAELYDAYLTYHTGEVRQVSGSVVHRR